jgi:hypothetical protein
LRYFANVSSRRLSSPFPILIRNFSFLIHHFLIQPNPPAYKSALTCIREVIFDDKQTNRPAEPEPTEDGIIDVEVEVIAEKIISDWRQLHQSLMHTSPASPEERGREEEPTQGPALPPIRMNKPSAYTTDREVEEIMKYQSSWDIVDPEPAEKKSRKSKSEDSKRHLEGPFDVEDSLPGHLKELRRTLTRLRETAKQARRNLDQVRRLAYDADLIQIGIQG